jgi:hypothetical protein
MNKAIFLAICLFLATVTIASAQTQCTVPAGAPGTPVVSTAAEGSRVLKASRGCIISGYVTTGAVAGYMMIFNATSAPADGAVTPINCVYVPANTTIGLNWAPQPPEWYSTGITVVFSSTGCFTKTVSATAFFHALVQ